MINKSSESYKDCDIDVDVSEVGYSIWLLELKRLGLINEG